MLPMHNVVQEVVHTIIPMLEQGLLDTGRPVVHRRVHPEAMELIHQAYFAMTLTLKQRPHEYETTAMEAALGLAGAAIKFVADLGDPRVLRWLADPDALVNAPELDTEQHAFDEQEQVEWRPLRDMPPIGMLNAEERERSRQVYEHRKKAEELREKRAKGLVNPPTEMPTPLNRAPGQEPTATSAGDDATQVA
jgi:hypothetical protein